MTKHPGSNIVPITHVESLDELCNAYEVSISVKKNHYHRVGITLSAHATPDGAVAYVLTGYDLNGYPTHYQHARGANTSASIEKLPNHARYAAEHINKHTSSRFIHTKSIPNPLGSGALEANAVFIDANSHPAANADSILMRINIEPDQGNPRELKFDAGLAALTNAWSGAGVTITTAERDRYATFNRDNTHMFTITDIGGVQRLYTASDSLLTSGTTYHLRKENIVKFYQSADGTASIQILATRTSS